MGSSSTTRIALMAFLLSSLNRQPRYRMGAEWPETLALAGMGRASAALSQVRPTGLAQPAGNPAVDRRGGEIFLAAFRGECVVGIHQLCHRRLARRGYQMVGSQLMH